MCYGVARPESAAGSSPYAVASTAGCAVLLGFSCQHLLLKRCSIRITIRSRLAQNNGLRFEYHYHDLTPVT